MRPVALLPAGLLLVGCGQEAIGAEQRPGAPKVTGGSVMTHVRALQRIADRHGGNRAAGTAGHRASARYVARRLRRAGYRVHTEPVDFFTFHRRGRPRLDSRATGRLRVSTLEFSGSGRVRARAAAAGLGCAPSDFGSFPRGRVAVMRRGKCTLRRKALGAQRAGATAAVVFNSGGPGRKGLLREGTLGSPGVDIPAVFATNGGGEALLRTGGRVNVAVRAVTRRRTTHNVIGDSRFGSGPEHVVLGGHLDSVPEGPGINDNASGASTVLAIAEREASRPRPGGRALRVGFWGAEELGLLGSQRHVRDLSESERKQILAYVNLDMIGSRRGRRYTYGSDEPVAQKLNEAARAVIRARGGTPRRASLRGNSDHEPFQSAGVPVYGLFSGAGAPEDRCYHRRCDRIGQIGRRTLDDLSRAAAAAVAAALDPRKVAR